jgi:hypothetical protein
MSAARFIGQVVATAEEVKRGQLARPSATENQDPTEAGDRLAAKWLEAALGASPEKALSVAHLLGVSESMISHMRAGRKSTPLRALFGLDRRAVVALVEALLVDLAPDHEIRRKDAMSHDRAEKAIARAAAEWEPMRAVIVRRAAEAEGVEPEELEAAYAGGGGK